MPQHLAISGLCLGGLLLLHPYLQSQNSRTYDLKVAVDEVEITFHAGDIHGLPVSDLRQDEVRLLDNERPPRRIVLFELLRDLPIRAGIMLDTSASMDQHHQANQAIASAYIQHFLNPRTDSAFVMSFGQRFQVREPWSNHQDALTAAIQKSGFLPSTTALFDAIYAACRYQFGKLDHASSGNFILLFTDGEDDASFLSLEDAANMCQHTNTAIYTFRQDDQHGDPEGLRTIARLASLTGGHVFPADDSPQEMEEDLKIIQANLRNQYRLVYNPADLKRDGAFHRIVLLPPDRVATVQTRSGYYAPKDKPVTR
ncbi:VWA domain-containing protein [Edaphobacter sp. 12200R-103]|uniref:VWA domain-containing protein n=1 Tax=Edaphobacter sp. 12200R-103 TaxID=2703788 RepID=UPI00138D5745|nr:VWA domain-containing protein [Edaphobacter sp. 12200R-103]QHS52039.1 VWA domain-containing protein [Edaphobacter sp. 12200R-103]